MRKAIIPSERRKVLPQPKKQRRHVRRYESGKKVVVNPKNKPSKISTLSNKNRGGLEARKGRYPSKTKSLIKPLPRDSTAEIKKKYQQYLKDAPEHFIAEVKAKGIFRGLASMPVCPICGETTGNSIIMSKDLSKTLTTQPVSVNLCEKCFKKYLLSNDAVIAFIFDKHIWTGDVITIQGSALKKIFDVDLDKIRKTKTIFLQKDIFDAIFKEKK